MKITSLRLRGFTGIRRGLGLDELFLDLSQLSGLIALSGENGKGKSTVMDCMSPYRQLASRSKSLQHHVFLRDSLKELCFEYAGDSYRTLIKIDSDSERTEAFAWKNGQPQVNGKVSEYDKYITGLFGSSQLFFSSVFCAQNAEKISDMTTGELKKLFSEFLKLERLVEFENTAKQCVALLMAKADGIQRDIQAARKSLEGMESLDGKLDNTEVNMKETKQIIKIITQDMIDMEREIESARAKAEENRTSMLRIKDMQATILKLDTEEDADTVTAEKELSVLREKTIAIMNDVKASEKLLESKAAIEKAIFKVTVLEAHIADNAEQVTTIFSEQLIPLNDQFKIAVAELEASKSRLSAIISNPDVRVLEAKIKGLKEKLHDLDKKDPECISTTCSFITGALRAQTELLELEPRVLNIKTEIETLSAAELEIIKQKTKETNDILSQLDAAGTAKKEIEAKSAVLKTNLAAARVIAVDQSKIAVAEARLDDLRQRKEEAIEDGKRIKAAWDERIARKRSETEAICLEMKNAKQNVDVLAENRLSYIQSVLASHRARMDEETASMARLGAAIVAIEKEITAKAEIDARVSALVIEHGQIVIETAEWLYLKNACSKDGLRALEIDSVAPIISGYANDLLTQTFGPQYTVKLRTQDEETGKEVLDILTIREDGSEVNIENLSGGERVWSLKALSLAMTLISKERSGRDFKTMFCDESDGALDTGNAINFVQMYRSLMKIADIDTCFFISHKEETIGLADHVLKFSTGGVVID
jgi:exonuclease SbcC